MQKVVLDLSHEYFFCPVTGQLIKDDHTYQPSPATMFTFVDDVGEFETLHPDLQEKWDKVKEQAEHEEEDEGDYIGTEDLFDRFLEQVNNPSLVCFIITTRGMACGPVSSTVRIGIDMDREPDEMEDTEDEDEDDADE